jgi:hypothetical protein
MVLVVSKVATLTHGFQVIVSAIFWCVVKVRHCQNNLASGNRMRLSVHSFTAHSGYNVFALALRPFFTNTL